MRKYNCASRFEQGSCWPWSCTDGRLDEVAEDDAEVVRAFGGAELDISVEVEDHDVDAMLDIEFDRELGAQYVCVFAGEDDVVIVVETLIDAEVEDVEYIEETEFEREEGYIGVFDIV
jgi:hypothetical protein